MLEKTMTNNLRELAEKSGQTILKRIESTHSCGLPDLTFIPQNVFVELKQGGKGGKEGNCISMSKAQVEVNLAYRVWKAGGYYLILSHKRKIHVYTPHMVKGEHGELEALMVTIYGANQRTPALKLFMYRLTNIDSLEGFVKNILQIRSNKKYETL